MMDCGNNSIVFNPEKFHFAEKEVDLSRFHIMEDGIKPTKRMMEAILQFPTPKNITNIRSWFGLVNHVLYTFSQDNGPFLGITMNKELEVLLGQYTQPNIQ